MKDGNDKLKKITGGDRFEDLTPKDIVKKLDEYIIGQVEAKRAIAVAIRNRLRRLRAPTTCATRSSPRTWC